MVHAAADRVVPDPVVSKGDIHAAAQWTTAAGLSADDEPDYPQEPAYLVLAGRSTRSKHVTHVLGKLGAANRTEAAARARQLGLIP